MNKIYEEVLKKGIKSFTKDSELGYFRENIEKMLVNMLEYSDAKYQELYSRVENSILFKKAEYDVYTAVVDKNDENLYNGILFPMAGSEIGKVDSDGWVVVKSGVINLEYGKLKRLEESGRIFSATVDGFELEAKVIRNLSADKAIEELYGVMRKNMIPWRPILAPYARKYFDVLVKPTEEKIDVKNAKVDLEEFEEHWNEDSIPVWNIKKSWAVMSKGAVAVREKYNYEYKFVMDDPEKCLGIILNASGGEIIDTIVNGKDVQVICEGKEMKEWMAYEFRNIETLDKESKDVIFTNADNGMKFGQMLRTKAAMESLFNFSERLTKNFELVSINVGTDGESSYNLYNSNGFIDNEFLRIKQRTKLEIKVREKNKTFVSEDLLSYFVSVVEMYHPEFECVVVKDD